MTSKAKYQQPSPETLEQSLKIARAIQRPGQTKEQTKLIAQGIQKGIEHYKKQQKAKARELDKKLKKVSAQLDRQHDKIAETGNAGEQMMIVYKRARLPWILLALTWTGIAVYFLTKIA